MSINGLRLLAARSTWDALKQQVGDDAALAKAVCCEGQGCGSGRTTAGGRDTLECLVDSCVRLLSWGVGRWGQLLATDYNKGLGCYSAAVGAAGLALSNRSLLDLLLLLHHLAACRLP
jgi:hypothetical protein